MKNQGLKIISLGMGVQSTCLYYMSSMGEMERADFAIFVDTGREKKKTLEYLDYLLQWQKDNNGIEILIIRKKDLFKDIMKLNDSAGHRWASIPAFTKNEDGSIGMLRRQCTTEYKIEQIDREIRILCMDLRQGKERPSRWYIKEYRWMKSTECLCPGKRGRLACSHSLDTGFRRSPLKKSKAKG
jgi:3'-phosphoadenosine 5'-phosphosulfate sulfotransferase (PAPS reductase)/FAD synthetase